MTYSVLLRPKERILLDNLDQEVSCCIICILITSFWSFMLTGGTHDESETADTQHF